MPRSEIGFVGQGMLLALLLLGCDAQHTESATSATAPTAVAADHPAPPPVVEKTHGYAIPDGFREVQHRGVVAHRGTVKGAVASSEVTHWATREPFDGDLDALLARERGAATSDGGALPSSGLLAGGPAQVLVGGEPRPGYARRMKLRFGDRTELRALVVHGGAAFIYHCEIAGGPNAWADVGAHCVANSTTFHVAPPS